MSKASSGTARTGLPTQAELEILNVLWKLGPATVKAIHEDLYPAQEARYTTVLKLLQIMAQKGLVSRDTRKAAHVYRANRSAAATRQHLVRYLAQRAFDGDVLALIKTAIDISRLPEDARDLLLQTLQKAAHRSSP